MNRDELLPGTLYLLILRTLARGGEMHGYEIAGSIQRISNDVLQVEEGSLYPALQRMLQDLTKRALRSEHSEFTENEDLQRRAESSEPCGLSSQRFLSALCVSALSSG
jgi:hypothetical protein